MDADEEVTEPEEHSMDPYDLLRDDPFALVPPEVIEQWDAKTKHRPHQQPQQPQYPERLNPAETAETTTAQPWSPESPPFTPPHIHVDDTEDLVSAESQSVRDPDDFRTHDTENEGSTDVSNNYRNFRWTEEKPRRTETDIEAEAEQDEEGPTSAFPDSPPSHPSQAADPVTIICSRGETTIYPEADETVPPTEDPTRITLPPYDHLSEYENDDAQEE